MRNWATFGIVGSGGVGRYGHLILGGLRESGLQIESCLRPHGSHGSISLIKYAGQLNDHFL